MRKGRLGYKPSALTIELNSSGTSAGKKLRVELSRWSIASLYIYHFLSVIDFSDEKYIVSTGQRYSWYQHRRYSEDADVETQTCNHLVINRVL